MEEEQEAGTEAAAKINYAVGNVRACVGVCMWVRIRMCVTARSCACV